MAQLTEGIGIGIAHLTTQVVAHTVEDARQLALQLDVTTKTGYWPWVVLQLIEVGDCPCISIGTNGKLYWLSVWNWMSCLYVSSWS